MPATYTKQGKDYHMSCTLLYIQYTVVMYTIFLVPLTRYMEDIHVHIHIHPLRISSVHGTHVGTVLIYKPLVADHHRSLAHRWDFCVVQSPVGVALNHACSTKFNSNTINCLIAITPHKTSLSYMCNFSACNNNFLLTFFLHLSFSLLYFFLFCCLQGTLGSY